MSIRTIVALRARRCPLQQIRAALREVGKLYPDLSNSQTLARLALLTDGKRVYLLTDEAQAMDVLTRQTVWAVPLGRHIIETTERVEKLPRAWTEQVMIDGHQFHVRIAGDETGKVFLAHCRELPGTLEHGATADEALDRLKAAVREVLSFMARERSSGTRVRRRAAN